MLAILVYRVDLLIFTESPPKKNHLMSCPGVTCPGLLYNGVPRNTETDNPYVYIGKRRFGRSYVSYLKYDGYSTLYPPKKTPFKSSLICSFDVGSLGLCDGICNSCNTSKYTSLKSNKHSKKKTLKKPQWLYPNPHYGFKRSNQNPHRTHKKTTTCMMN